jgi:hypothetical protein
LVVLLVVAYFASLVATRTNAADPAAAAEKAVFQSSSAPEPVAVGHEPGNPLRSTLINLCHKRCIADMCALLMNGPPSWPVTIW